MSKTDYPNLPIPAQAGIGLRAQHYHQIATEKPAINWLETHTENFFGDGGLPHQYLDVIRSEYPLSLHGVGLSLGSADALNKTHVEKIKQTVDRYQPDLVSEHLCWGATNGRHLNDLLPLPYTEEAIKHISEHIDEFQNALGRQIIIENVSSYLEFSHSTMPEWEFLHAVSQKSGCGILLDINNIYVSAINHNFNANDYLSAIPVESVKEMHLAGFDNVGHTLIDTHAHAPCDEVWQLYQQALQRFGATPTLIEWDTDIPSLDVLIGEANKAQQFINQSAGHVAA